MAKVHDRGGRPSQGPIDRGEHLIEDWERRTHALLYLLNRKGMISVDQHRRAIESLPPEDYESLSYYERWAAGIEALLTEKHILARDDIDAREKQLRERWRGR